MVLLVWQRRVLLHMKQKCNRCRSVLKSKTVQESKKETKTKIAQENQSSQVQVQKTVPATSTKVQTAAAAGEDRVEIHSNGIMQQMQMKSVYA